MPNFTDLTGLAGVASVSTAAFMLLPGIASIAKPRLAVLLGAVFVLMLIPFSELPLAAYLRGATGDLSITTLMLLCCALARPWFGCGASDTRDRRALWLLVALAAVAIYPMALGVGAFDPYRLGYGDPQFIAALLMAAMAAWFWQLPLIAVCIAFAILAWTVGWYESDNLWDYLLDPFVSIHALAAIMTHAVKALLHRGRLPGSQLPLAE